MPSVIDETEVRRQALTTVVVTVRKEKSLESQSSNDRVGCLTQAGVCTPAALSIKCYADSPIEGIARDAMLQTGKVIERVRFYEAHGGVEPQRVWTV